MTAITADMFARTPPFACAAEALNAIRRARAAAWARSSGDDVTRICAIALIFENVTLALNLLRDLDEAQRSGDDNRIRRVRRRFDKVLAALAANQET